MLGLVVALAFIALNGFFVAAEFALVKVSATGLSKTQKGDRRAAATQGIVTRLERYLSVTQLGITLASLGLGWIGEPAIEDLIHRALARLTGHETSVGLLHGIVVVVAFTLLTLAHVLFGELIPKLVAIQRSEAIALSSALPLRVTFLTFRPLLWVLEKLTVLLLRGMGLSADAASEGKLSEEEIVGILATNVSKGSQGKAKAELVERVMRFSQRTARHAMVPRVDVFCLPIETSGEEAARHIRSQMYSRVVLTKGRSLDEVAGYLYAKDFLLDETAPKMPNLWGLRRDVLFVPETQSLLDVLREMQRSQTPIAVVVDEYGGSSGIATMEDLLEEIVGEIRDETDVEPARVTKVDETSWDVDARTEMHELSTLGLTVAAEEGPETLGTIVLSRLGRLPRRGDKVELGGGTAEVTSVSRRRVIGVRVRLRSSGDPPVT